MLYVEDFGNSDATATVAIAAEITSITSQISGVMTGATYNGAATISGLTITVTDLATTKTSISLTATKRGSFGNAISAAESNSRAQDALAENLQAAESRVRDADMATEMVSFTKDSIIQQAAQAMLAQANQLPQSIIGLLQ